MSDLLAGTRAIVTGASRGIGLATSLLMAQSGASVAMLSRKPYHDADVTGADMPGRLLPVAADVADPVSAQRACAEATNWLGGVDVVVNNAGVPGPRGPLWTIDSRAAAETFAVNTLGPLNILRAVLPEMIRAGSGVVINVSSGQAVRPKVDSGIYGASKAALDHLIAALAMELAGTGIRVHGVYPGPTDTALNSTAHSGNGQPRSRLRPPEEPATLITWLASRHGALAGAATVAWRDEDVKRRLRAMPGFPQ